MVQLLTMKPRRCQLVSWYGQVLRRETENSHLVLGKGRAGEVWGGQRAGQLLSLQH